MGVKRYDISNHNHRKAVVNRLVFERIAHRFVGENGLFNCAACAREMKTSQTSVAALARKAGYTVAPWQPQDAAKNLSSVQPVDALFSKAGSRRSEAPIFLGYDDE